MQGKKFLLCAAAMAVLLLSGCAAAKQESRLGYVGADTAKNAALQSAGITKEEASGLSSDVKTRDGQDYYEVTFSYNDRAYTYDVDAFTGLVIGGDTAPNAPDELPSTGNVTVSGGNTAGIGEEKASGEIVTYDYDAEGHATPAVPEDTGNTSGTGNTSAIGEARAKEIALAQVPGAKASDIKKFKVDYDDGRMKYEGKIIYNKMEYEFEIDAYSGKIIDWDSERYDPYD